MFYSRLLWRRLHIIWLRTIAYSSPVLSPPLKQRQFLLPTLSPPNPLLFLIGVLSYVVIACPLHQQYSCHSFRGCNKWYWVIWWDNLWQFLLHGVKRWTSMLVWFFCGRSVSDALYRSISETMCLHNCKVFSFISLKCSVFLLKSCSVMRLRLVFHDLYLNLNMGKRQITIAQ